MQNIRNHTQPPRKTHKTTQPYFDVTRTNLECFLHKEPQNTLPSTALTPQDHPQEYCQSQARQGQNPSSESGPVDEPPDLAIKVANEIIKRIQKEGIETNWSDNERSQEDCEAPDSPLQNSFSCKNIWRNQWGSNSISKSLYSTQHSQSCASLSQAAFSTYSLTPQSSSPSLSFEGYPHMQFMNGSDTQSSFYYNQSYAQAKISQSFEIVFEQILEDGRTTVMIKNIPNKYSLSALADEIDKTHLAEYDFLYLPFDYNSKCNMGYAFINFLDAQNLLTFHMVFQERRWAKFRSEKICALSYARLQGKTDLIEHFHQSKVLNQKGKCFRPIIRSLDDIKQIISQQKRNSTQN